MTDAVAQNPFAPPRAHVEDHAATGVEMVPATRMSRLLAILIDAVPTLVIAIVALVAVAVSMPQVFSGHFEPRSINWVGLAAVMLLVGVLSIAWAAWQIVLLYRYGQTIGKKAMGIRVVRMDGSRVSFARFFFIRGGAMVVIRIVVGAIAGALQMRHGNLLGFVVTLVDSLMIFGSARRCGHDYIADTRVVTAASSPNATLEGIRRL